MRENNICLLTDSYKLSHAKQYPKGTTNVYSYLESRTGAKFDYCRFFGLQYILKKYLEGIVVTPDKINAAKLFADVHMGRQPNSFNEQGWRRIIEKHNGMLPIEIKAVPEGVDIPTGNVLMTVTNTDPEAWWLPNFLETILVQVWYPTTVCTLSGDVRKIILRGLEISGNPDLLPFKLHDFGFRGSTSVESAGIGGLAHLVNFNGTDTIQAILTGIDYYDSGVCGFSIPASEHSTITSWGEDSEEEAYRNMLDTYPEGFVACVSDSFDIFNACANIWGGSLKDKILNRNGILVIRPDSGEIISTVNKVIRILADKFGTTVNHKGFKVLNDKVRVIQGDGCTHTTIGNVIDDLIKDKFSIDNIAFGMGGGLLQKVDRDTQRFAFKASCATVDGVDRDVFKRPLTDPTKNSKRGRLKLVKHGSIYKTVSLNSPGEDLLSTVFLNGELIHPETFDTIKSRARQ